MLNYSEAGKILVQPKGVSKVGDTLGRDCVVRKIEAAKLESGTTEKTAPPAFEAKAEDWELLLSYAAKTYVPSSEASRLSGAGAGLNDND